MIRRETDKPLSEQYQDHTKHASELVFLQSQSNFIEKTLGANEKMRIRPECIVAYGPSVNIQRDNHGGGVLFRFSSRGNFVTLTGPGLVYIDMQVGNRFFKKDQMSLFVVALYFVLYVFMIIMAFNGVDVRGIDQIFL